MTQRFRGNEYRTTVICVDSYQNAVLTGRFYNPACKEEIRFQSLSQLLVKMQDASWQGSVTWLEQGQEESFRSVLELILLLDSALSGM